MSKKTSKLGRGLDALLPINFAKSQVINGSQEIVKELELSKITPKKDQPRNKFDVEKIEQLSYSIKAHGVLQPIVVVPKGDGYEIVAGERRYRAAKKAGLKTIPAMERSLGNLEQLEIALVENIQREDLTPIEQALSVRRLKDEFSQSYEQIAKRLGKAETTVINMARLLNLPAPLQQSLQDGQISEGHARALLALNDKPELQSLLFRHIVEAHWSVRRAETFVQTHKNTNKMPKLSSKTVDYKTKAKELEDKLSRPVKIIQTSRGGRITINFKDDQDLEELLNRL